MSKRVDLPADAIAGNMRAELHDKLRVVDGKTHRLRVNVRECWLEYALHRCWIDQRQYQAGMDLRSAFERSSLHSQKAIDYGKEPVDGGGMSDAIIVDSMDKARWVVSCVVAVDRIEFPLGQVCRRVSIEDQGARDIERVFHWRNGHGMLMVRSALDELATHVERSPCP